MPIPTPETKALIDDIVIRTLTEACIELAVELARGKKSGLHVAKEKLLAVAVDFATALRPQAAGLNISTGELKLVKEDGVRIAHEALEVIFKEVQKRR